MPLTGLISPPQSIRAEATNDSQYTIERRVGASGKYPGEKKAKTQ
jgi:hypothetical protein